MKDLSFLRFVPFSERNVGEIIYYSLVESGIYVFKYNAHDSRAAH